MIRLRMPRTKVKDAMEGVGVDERKTCGKEYKIEEGTEERGRACKG